MKKIFAVYLVLFSLANCTDSGNDNPILPNVAVNQTVYLNNPSNNDLLFPGGYVLIPGGIKGIVVYRGNGDLFYAFDLACPHLPPNDCTKMTVDGLNMICTCDDTKFALALGGAPQSGTKYPAKEYKVVKNGETLKITNF